MHLIAVPDWAEARGASLNAFDALEARGTALLIIDMQNAFIAEGEVYANPHARDIIPAVNRLSAAMRTIRASVIFTRQTFLDEGPYAEPPWRYDLSDPKIAAGAAALRPGAAGHGLHPDVKIEASDLILDKHRYGALSCPAGGVSRALKDLAMRMVIIAGTLTNVCCETTAREAYMAGYKVIVATDATAAATDAEQNASLLNLRLNFADLKTADELIAMVGATGRCGRAAG
ncbi:MAG: cysteine hydrolase family protein [Caulobacteraceae bacterium]